jgi:CRP-like cAMP-binding protein
MLKIQQNGEKMKKYFEILKKCSLFHEIEDEKLERMLHCLGARVEFFDKKYTVFSEGSPAKQIGILLSGAVQMFRVDYYGNRSLLEEVHPGELFGEAFACAEVPSIPVSIIATKESEIMLIDASHILHTCSNNCLFHQQMIFNLMKALAQKSLRFHQRLDVTSKRTTREKLLTYLNLCSKEAGSDVFEIPFDRQELADYLEVDRSGLSAEIGKLKKEGFIENEKSRFRLL